MPYENTPSSTDALKQLKERLSKLETETGRKKGLVEFRPKPGDVIIATPPKCGTTMVCQIVQSLRSNGDMSFEEINMVIPCLEMAFDSGIEDVEMAQEPYRPHVFKTHAWYPHCPKSEDGQDVKYIYVVRNPVKAAISFYWFLGGWFFDKDEITMDEFVNEFVLRRSAPQNVMQNASIWDNIASWYPHAKENNVLWLFYEDVVEDKEKYVRLIAEFLGITGEERVRKAVEQSSMEFMQAWPTKYDEHMLKYARNIACGLDRDAGLTEESTGKVRDGKSAGSSKVSISEECLAKLEEKWNKVVSPVTGCETYENLRKKLNEELGRS